jgi:hypothetical protein
MNGISAYLLAVTSNWWEPGTPNAFDVGDASAILGLLVASFGVFVGIMRWWLGLLKTIIKEEIEKATEPIHPNANGGLSLADVARKTNQLEASINTVQEMQAQNRDMLLKLVEKIIDIEEDLEDLGDEEK